MIDWSVILCSGPIATSLATSFLPPLLHTLLLLLFKCGGDLHADPNSTCYSPYPYRVGSLTYTPAPLGVVVGGVNLSRPVSDDVIKQLKRDVHIHRILIFKNQGKVSGERQVEISKWFGEMEINYSGVHHASPHPDIVRISNDQRVGLTVIGSHGWHIDGTHLVKPTSIAIYHIVKPARGADTEFVPLREMVERLSADRRGEWDRLWRKDHTGWHPVLYTHPVTSHPTMMFHTNPRRSRKFMLDYGTDNETKLFNKQADKITKAIEEEIERDNRSLVYRHKWESGDVLITDNLALAHKGVPETQESPDNIGLRILHRSTVAGKWKPEKNFDDYVKQVKNNIK